MPCRRSATLPITPSLSRHRTARKSSSCPHHALGARTSAASSHSDTPPDVPPTSPTARRVTTSSTVVKSSSRTISAVAVRIVSSCRMRSASAPSARLRSVMSSRLPSYQSTRPAVSLTTLALFLSQAMEPSRRRNGISYSRTTPSCSARRCQSAQSSRRRYKSAARTALRLPRLGYRNMSASAGLTSRNSPAWVARYNPTGTRSKTA